MQNRTIALLSAASLAVLTLVITRPAFADSASLVFETPTITATAGSTVTFRGTITNLEGTSLTLVGDTVSQLDAAFTSFDDTAFITLTPVTLAGNASLPANGFVSLFTVTIDAGAAPERTPATSTFSPTMPQMMSPPQPLPSMSQQEVPPPPNPPPSFLLPPSSAASSPDGWCVGVSS